MSQLTCVRCGTVGLQPGFVEDTGRASFGFVRWIPGLLERGLLGVAKSSGRPRFRIDAFRCPSCAHLELFAAHQV